jgi:hypothetical protein
MTTRSGCSYGDNQLNPQQQNDLLLDMVQQLGSFSNQLGALTQRVDVLWDQLFDKPESSGEKVKVKTEDTEIHQNSATKEEMPHEDTVDKCTLRNLLPPIMKLETTSHANYFNPTIFNEYNAPS